MSQTVLCCVCSNSFEARRKTARFCGGTCRQRWNREQQRINNPPAPPTLDDEIKAGIGRIYRAIQAFTGRYKLSDLVGVEYGPLLDALETLDALFDCEDCGERRANGWENIELCRKCEIQTFELVCNECEKRKPSVRSEDQLCAKCEKGEG